MKILLIFVTFSENVNFSIINSLDLGMKKLWPYFPNSITYLDKSYEANTINKTLIELLCQRFDRQQIQKRIDHKSQHLIKFWPL